VTRLADAAASSARGSPSASLMRRESGSSVAPRPPLAAVAAPADGIQAPSTQPSSALVEVAAAQQAVVPCVRCGSQPAISLLHAGAAQDPQADVATALTDPGPSGEAGPKGPPGVQGAQGLAGLPGPPADATGIDMKTLVGARGAPGPKGCDGNQGQVGARGPTGARGPLGKQGVFTQLQKKRFEAEIEQLAQTLANGHQMQMFEQHILRKRLDALREHLGQLQVHLGGDEEKVRQAGQEVRVHLEGQIARIEAEAAQVKAAIEADRLREQSILQQEAELRDQVLSDTQEVQRKMA